MKRLALASLAAIAAALAAPCAAAAPPTTAVASARAHLLAGDPSLAGLTLVHERTSSLPDGRSVVRFAQRHAGAPVLSRGATVLFDVSGQPTKLASAAVERGLPAQASPSVAAAIAALRATKTARVAFAPSDAKLAWLPTHRGARLVWTFYRSLAPLPYAPAIAVDAETGRVIIAQNAVRFDRAATVHEINPVTTPTPAPVVLDALPQGAQTLTSPLLRVNNCIDEGTLTGGNFPFHACEMQQLAVADAQGDFPWVFTSDNAQEDEYAEVVMFYHASKAYAYMTSVGMPDLAAQPLDLVVNLRLPAGFDTFDFNLMSDPTLPLEPYNNAFFSPENPFFGSFGPEGPGLWFGQGTFTDFAYDGDVVYHEFGHAMVDRTIDLVYYWHLDSQGALPAPGAMNEGLADYFSSAITGDSQVGEYAAQNFVQAFAGNIRDLDNDHSCPAHVVGESHADSTLFSGALWSVRKTLPSDQQKELDTAVMTALVTAPSGYVGYEDVAQHIVSAIELSPLGTTVADALTQELTKRGVLPKCTRIIEYTGQPIVGYEPKLAFSIVAPGNHSVTLDGKSPYVPGVFQVHLALEEDTAKVRVTMDEVQSSQPSFGESDPYEPALLARFADTPIEFTYDNDVASSNAGEPIDVTSFGTAEIDVPEGATDLYVMVVNLGEEDGRYTDLTLLQQKAPSGTGGTGGFSGSGGFGGTSAGAAGTTSAEPEDPELTPAGGCACRTSSGSSAPGALALTALLGLALARRRRR